MDTSLISAFSVFDPQKLPDKETEDFFTYGNDQIDVLASHFNQTLDAEALALEWIGFKEVLAIQFTQLSSSQVMQSLLQKDFVPLYPELSKLAHIGLVIPISTATCERGFSAMKRIKTDLRNRLTTRVLDCLMGISIDGPDLESFDFDRAATKWGSRRNRRIKL